MVQEKTKRRLLSQGIFMFLLQFAAVLVLSAIQAFQLHYSCVSGFLQFLVFLRQSYQIVLLNVLILLWFNLGVKLLLQKWYISLTVTSFLVTLWSVANYYVLKFHGSPLFFSEFANFGTAMNVIGGYKFALERRIIWMLLLGLAEIAVPIFLFLKRKRGEKFIVLKKLLFSLLAFCGVTVLLWMLLFVWQKPKPRETVFWTWREGIDVYGYPALIVEDADKSMNFLRVPNGYSPEHLDAVSRNESKEVPSNCPDIILIVNESFCDLSVYTEYTTDVDPFEAFHGIDGAFYGKVVIPNVGGKTNNTEFEVLTGNSTALLTRLAPFNYVNFSQDDTNAARYLDSLGYSSAALHCEPASNYSRNRAYPAMGFDTVVMGNENFICNQYGDRRILDEDNYQDLIRIGESLGSGPRFLYLLTFQNHGGWETNDESFDTVHVQEDLGEMTGILNEYLTSIRMSSEAFRGLTEQFAESDRPTVICMLGDHAPSFITELTPDPSFSQDEKQIRLRMVPYVIWANFDLTELEETEYATAVDLMPMLYRAAGLPTTAYQDYILELHAQVPIRTTVDVYQDADGVVGRIQGSRYQQTVQLYYDLEYNALSRGGSYRRELFICPAASNAEN